jgi:hypothetical protein
LFRTARSPNVFFNSVFGIATAKVEARYRTSDFRTRLNFRLKRQFSPYLYHALIALDPVFDEAIVAAATGNVERKEASPSVWTTRCSQRFCVRQNGPFHQATAISQLQAKRTQDRYGLCHDYVPQGQITNLLPN